MPELITDAAPDLSAKEERIAELYAAGKSPREIAEECGHGLKTVYTKLRHPLVRALVADIRGRQLRPVVDWLNSRLMTALQLYDDVISDEDESTRTRLHAAEAMLTEWHKFWNLSDIQARLSALEAAADALPTR